MSARGARRGTSALVALAISFVVGAAEASPEDLFGYGARTSAMGATGAAHAQGYEAAFHDPALASTFRANKLTLGFTGAVFRLDASGPGLPGRYAAAPARGFVIGAEVPVPFGGKLRDRVGIGLGFYTPDDVIVRGRVLHPDETQFPHLPDRAQSLMIRGAIGADVGFGVRVGVGFAALAEIVGSVVAATDATGRVGTRVENQLVATYAPTFGVTYDLPPTTKLRLGVAFRGELDARFNVLVDGTKLTSLPIPLFNISGTAQYDPAQVAIEVARIDGPSVLALQLVYKRWSDYGGILEPTVVCKDGGAGACGLVPPSIAFEDTLGLRLGAEHAFRLARGATFRARGGAFYETSPLPRDLPVSEAFDVATLATVTVPTRYFDANRVALTFGGGLSLAKPLPPIDLDVFGQLHALVPTTFRSKDGAGTVFSEGEASGVIAVFGMTAGARF